MGQQQLLLLVVGVVVVALAVVVGIAAFSENAQKAEFDRLTVEAHRVAATAYGWKQTPRALSGGGGVPYYSTLTLESLGFKGVAVTNGGSEQVATVGDLEYRLQRRELPRTHVHVVNTARNIGVAVFFLGPETACFAYRQDFVRNGQTAYLPGLTPPLPAGCSGW